MLNARMPAVAAAIVLSTFFPNLAVSHEANCYAKALMPAKFQPEEIRLLKKEESRKITIKHAIYEEVEESVEIKPEEIRLVQVPATYQTIKEEVLVAPERMEWQPGRGENERFNELTGQYMHQVEVPAKYESYEMSVIDIPAHTKEEIIPAEYTTIKVQKLVKPAEVEEELIPAEYQNVVFNKQVSEPTLEWTQVVCSGGTVPSLIRKVQAALQAKKYELDQVDGFLGKNTLAAMNAFAADNDLLQVDSYLITYELLNALNIDSSVD